METVRGRSTETVMMEDADADADDDGDGGLSTMCDLQQLNTCVAVINLLPLPVLPGPATNNRRGGLQVVRSLIKRACARPCAGHPPKWMLKTAITSKKT